MAGTLSKATSQRGWRIKPEAVRAGCAGAVAVIMAVGMLLAWRRLAGAAARELPAGLLLGAAIGAAGIVLGSRYAWQLTREPGERRNREELLLRWGGTAAVVLLTAGCSYPGNRAVDWLVWLPVIALEAWGTYLLQRRPPAATPLVRSRLLESEGEVGASHGDPPEESPLTSLVPPSEDQGLLVQDVHRLRDAEGVETIHAVLRAEFVAGQRHAVLHVGFCPPLARTPVVDVETGEGPEAEVRVVQSLCHGARLELRLAEAADEDCAVMVELAARPQEIGFDRLSDDLVGRGTSTGI